MRSLLLFLPVILLFSCSGNDKNPLEAEQKANTQKHDSLRSDKGIQGIYNVPEMLTLAIKDSGTVENVTEKMAMAYDAIGRDLDSLQLEIAGSHGLLIYTNDPKNFVFECVLPIKNMPNIKPKYSSVVILEETRAVIYNHYGAYDKMNEAYEKLKVYLKENKLIQTSATREFYITDPQAEPDTAKWLSRIYVPVK